MKKQNEEKKKQKPKVVLGNIWFALRIIHRAAPGFLLVSGVCNLLNGFRNALTNVLILRYVVNAVQTGEDFWTVAGVVLVCFAIHLGLNILLNYFSPWMHPNVYIRENMLKVRVYIDKLLQEKARSLDLEAYEDPAEYDNYFKAREDSLDHILSVYWCFADLSFRASDLTTSAAVIFSIDPWLALFVCLPAISSLLFKKANDLNYESDLKKKKCRRARDYALRSFYLVDFVKEMRMGNFPELMKWRFGEEVEAQKRIIRAYAPRLTVLNFLGSFLQEILLAFGAIGYTVWQALGTGRILYGDCLVVINSISSVSWGIISITDSVTWMLKESLYISNIRDFLDAEIGIQIPEQPKEVRRGDLEFRNVSFTYRGAEQPTIKNLSFTVRDGEKIALVGQNGAGKTTIAKLMLRLYDVTEGEILYGGVNIKELSLAEYRNAFSVVFQDFKNFSTNVAENVLLRPLKEGEEQAVLAALDKAGFTDKLKTLPNGLDTRLTREFDDKGENLSGGESQKLSIARIYAKEASIAILDEPTSALDPIAEYHMYENMMDACRDRSVVFISHRLSSAVLADRVILLENGEVAEIGTHKELLSAGGKYAKMFEMQAEKYRESEVRADG